MPSQMPTSMENPMDKVRNPLESIETGKQQDYIDKSHDS